MELQHGEIVISDKIKALINTGDMREIDIKEGLERHRKCEFGAISNIDKEVQKRNIVKNIGCNIIGVYKSIITVFWVVSEWDRKRTLVFVPDEMFN